MEEHFRKIASKVSEVSGSFWYFCFWIFLTLAWLAWGPFRHFDDTWNFYANTSTTVLTFLTVILLQCMQNRSAKETELKLDEIIRAIKPAQNKFIDLKSLSDVDLKKLEKDIKSCIEEGSCKKEKL